MTVFANATIASWNVKYSGYPKPTIIWRDPHNNEIPWTELESHDHKIEAKRFEHQTTLTIRKPTISDSGNYTLHAENGIETKDKKFELFVGGM